MIARMKELEEELESLEISSNEQKKEAYQYIRIESLHLQERSTCTATIRKIEKSLHIAKS